MSRLDRVSGFLDRHKTTAAFVGGFMSVTLGAAYWLALGGAQAFVTSMQALGDPEIAETLAGLPDYHARVEGSLERMEETLALQAAALSDLSDTLESYRVRSEQVVQWAPERSQRLTDAVGGCSAGQVECPVYLRGRRTQAGAGCDMRTARPKLLLADGRDYPIRFSPGFEPPSLTKEWETIQLLLEIPGFIGPGYVGIVILTVYADCPFAGEGEMVSRETFRLALKINAPRD